MNVENPPCFGLKPGIQNQKTSGMGMASLEPLAEGEPFDGQTPPTIRSSSLYTPDTNQLVTESSWFCTGTYLGFPSVL